MCAAGRCLDARLPRICALFKDRCETLVDLARWVRWFYVDTIAAQCRGLGPTRHSRSCRALLDAFVAGFGKPWSGAKKPSLRPSRQVLKEQGVKMPQLAMPVRVLTLGTAHTRLRWMPVLELLGRRKSFGELAKPLKTCL